MAVTDTNTRGTWNTKLGFILAAAGSAVGLGNIWRFPTEAASNGGGAFLIIYLICCFIIGFPVMMAELSIGRNTRKNPVGAFKALAGGNKLYPLIGIWGVLCGIMILSYYTVIAGWTVSYIFEELFFFMGFENWAIWIADTENGLLNTLFSILFMGATISIIVGGVADGIERATKTMMPMLIVILVVLIAYVISQPSSSEGLELYLMPDFSSITPTLIFAAMGQAFFSLSLGMGALITYGSYLNKKENIPQAAALVTFTDIGVAFLAGLLILPAMFMAQAQGVPIFENGAFIAGSDLIFEVLPALFHELGGFFGFIFGIAFFILLSVAALTSTISLLEVPVSYAIDEHNIPRKKAALSIGLGILAISLVIGFYLPLIDTLDLIFSQIGLPLGGIMICLFLGYVWKTQNAMEELESGNPGFSHSIVGKSWKLFIMIICPLVILFNLLRALFPNLM